MNLKKLPYKKKQLDEIINLIPMINLIFLLLIFFLLTGVVSKKDFINIERPKSEFGIKKKTIDDQIVFSVNQSNEIFYNNKIIAIKKIDEIFNSADKKYIIDIDKNASIYLLNQLIKKMKEKKINKVYIKVSGNEN